MLIAYLDEVGETGAFVSRSDSRYKTSPAFGYAGFILPEQAVHTFSREFHYEKHTLFAELIGEDDPGTWEAKGAFVFRDTTPTENPQNLRVFRHLVRRVTQLGGRLFYYASEKPLGTPRQTNLDQRARESDALKEALNRLARYADSHDENIMVIMDRVNEKERSRQTSDMYAHVFSRSQEHEDMRRIIEAPMHLDSRISPCIQFADWVAACVNRAIDYQLIKDSRFTWIPDLDLAALRPFTFESRLFLYRSSSYGFLKSDLFHRHRPRFDSPTGNRVASVLSEQEETRLRIKAQMRAVHTAAMRQRRKQV